MAKLRQSWPAREFDAISIRAARCEVEVQGVDEDEVGLEADFEGRDYDASLETEGRWLKLHRITRGGNQNILLKLSRSKPWVLNIFSGQGDIKVKDIKSRLNIMLGHGNARVEDCRGRLAISAGHADIQLKHFCQAEMPPEPAQQMKKPPKPSEPPAPHYKAGDRSRWSWYWEDTDWEAWGLDLGEKIAGWALSMGRFFERTTINPRRAGISIAIGQGDLHFDDITSGTCLARVGNGDIRLKSGQIGNLEVIASRGDVECASILPEGDWYIKAVHGDVHLSLPVNACARLDAATRHGDIRSEIPVVRVARQGPETFHGGRMVGVIGSKAEGEVPGLRISVTNGDIDLKSQAAVYPSSGAAVSAPARHEYRTQLEVLQALSRGQINVEEAEQQLHTLESREEKA